MDGLQYVEVYQAVKQKVLRQFWLTTSLTYSCTNELPYHVVSSVPLQHISLLIQTKTIAEFILEMENSSQTEKLPMKTRLNRNLETSAATLSYQFHLPRTYFSPTGIFSYFPYVPLLYMKSPHAFTYSIAPDGDLLAGYSTSRSKQQCI